jgi:hypothetical protein
MNASVIQWVLNIIIRMSILGGLQFCIMRYAQKTGCIEEDFRRQET